MQKYTHCDVIRESRVHACWDVNDAREPVYWLLYHQNRNSMPSCKSDSHKCVYMWTYVRGSHTRERTFCSRMLGIIIYKKLRGSQRRGYWSRHHWRRIVRVYIFWKPAGNHWWLSSTISPWTLTNEERITELHDYKINYLARLYAWYRILWL